MDETILLKIREAAKRSFDAPGRADSVVLFRHGEALPLSVWMFTSYPLVKDDASYVVT